MQHSTLSCRPGYGARRRCGWNRLLALPLFLVGTLAWGDLASLDKPASVDWDVTPPPGFQQVQKAVRSLPGKHEPVTHLVFSDGLSVLSMFLESANPNMQSLQGLSAEGAIGVYGRQVDGYNVTTLGEVPSMALIETGDSVKRK